MSLPSVWSYRKLKGEEEKMEKGFSEYNYASPDYSSFSFGYYQDELDTLLKMRGLIQSNNNRG
jgi:hypothetical protein